MESKKINQINETSNLRERKTSKEKLIILRELLSDKIPIGKVSEKYGIHLNVIYNWQKTFFEKMRDGYNKVRRQSVIDYLYNFWRRN